MNLSERSPLQRYGFAIGTTVLVVSLTIVGRQTVALPALPLLLAAVALSAWYGGLGPGLLSALIGVVASEILIFEPLYVVDLSPAGIARMALFSIVAVLISWLTESQRRIERAATF